MHSDPIYGCGQQPVALSSGLFVPEQSHFVIHVAVKYSECVIDSGLSYGMRASMHWFCFEPTWGMSCLPEECVPNRGDAEC